MKHILVFAGTSEGRQISELFSKSGIYHTVCVATSYGKELIEETPYVTIHQGRMDADEISNYIKIQGCSLVIDATHPYAYEVTANIKKAVEENNIKYLRVKRNGLERPDGEKIFCFDSNEECINALKKTEGNILLTVGSKELSLYASNPAIKDRLYVRIIPGEESLHICNELGINGKNIIAMQGPFSAAINEALIDQFSIKHMVTKQSGISGGFYGKVMSAENKGISLYVIGCMEEDTGLSVCECLSETEKITGKIIASPVMEIHLIGYGMGSEKLLTTEAESVIHESDVIIGDKRLVSKYKDSAKEIYEYYLSKDIIPLLEDLSVRNKFIKKKISVLFSGDSSFYSGATALYNALIKEINEGKLDADIRILPGVSSVSCLASRLGIPYSESEIISMHGRNLFNLAGRIRHNKKVFILLSGKEDVRRIGEKLTGSDLDGLKIIVGCNLSYEDERIFTLSPDECIKFDTDGMLVCLVMNEKADSSSVTHGLNDGEFIREKVPMTKEEVREVSICKLRLKSDSVLWDVGSGTGSISVECALRADYIRVYSIECKEEAADLTQKNAYKFGLENISVIRGGAPDSLKDLPMPTHVFIGGSGGKLIDILKFLNGLSCRIRVVINAVSFDTISKIESIPGIFDVDDFEIVQMQVSRTQNVSEHMMMKAENPIWICSFNLRNNES